MIYRIKVSQSSHQLHFNSESGIVTKGGLELSGLTATERLTLLEFVRAPGKLFYARELQNSVAGTKPHLLADGTGWGRGHVSRINKKFQEVFGFKPITNAGEAGNPSQGSANNQETSYTLSPRLTVIGAVSPDAKSLPSRQEFVVAGSSDRGGFLPGIPHFAYSLGQLDSPIGIDGLLKRSCRSWLTSPKRRALIWGPPGIGKSTLGRAMLRDESSVLTFGTARYEIKCDDMKTVGDLIESMARIWFGIIDLKPNQLSAEINARLLGLPSCGIFLDNLETLLDSDDPVVRKEMDSWLGQLAGLPRVWLLVGMQNRILPGGIEWPIHFEPKRMQIKYARALFCRASGNPKHRSDPYLDSLLEDVDFVAHAVKLLGASATGYPDLSAIYAAWNEDRFALLRGKYDENREESIKVSYEFAFSRLDSNAKKILRMIAWLPGGISERDLAEIHHHGSEGGIRLFHASLIERDHAAQRIYLLKPLRDYISAFHPISADDRDVVSKWFLQTASKGNLLGGKDDNHIINHLTTELSNLIFVSEIAIYTGDSEVVDATTGLARISAWTGLKRSVLRELLPLALAIAERFDNTNGSGTCLWASGELARLEDALPIADGFYQNAMKLYEAIGNIRGKAWSLRGRAEVARLVGNKNVATSYFEDAQRAFQEAQYPRGVAWCLRGLGEISLSENRLQEAKALFDVALLNLAQTSDVRGEAWCMLYLSDIDRLLGNLSRCADGYRTAAKKLEVLRDLRGIGWCTWGLGEVARCNRDYVQAARLYKDALGHFTSIGYRRGIAWSHRSLAKVAEAMANAPEVREHLLHAHDLFVACNEAASADRMQGKLLNFGGTVPS